MLSGALFALFSLFDVSSFKDAPRRAALRAADVCASDMPLRVYGYFARVPLPLYA